MNNKLYIVVPCYNEEEVIRETNKRLVDKVNLLIEKKIISVDSKILYVNDGSKDNTLTILKEISLNNYICSAINLSRNRGHQNALLAGLHFASDFADITISLDADLQDDINVIDKFIVKYNEGNDIVYGVRDDRKTDSFFKRSTAKGYYGVMRKLGTELVSNHADYRLLSSRVLKELKEYKEVNLFLRGIIPLIGYKSSFVYYKRNERFAGESKYPLKKMLAFAWEGITSLSVKPIRMISFLGFFISFLSCIAVIWTFVSKFLGLTVVGWSSIVLSIWFLGGIQLLSLGIIGEYIGKTYIEVKSRPRYSIDEVFGIER